MIEAAVLAQLINGGLAVVASLRRQGWTNEQINEHLDAIDAGNASPVSVDDVQVSLDRGQELLDAARKIT